MAIFLGWWESGVNAMPEHVSVLDGFHLFDSLLLPALPLLQKPHHVTQHFSINCFIFLRVCIAEAE
jgi:hypothetical protein